MEGSKPSSSMQNPSLIVLSHLWEEGGFHSHLLPRSSAFPHISPSHRRSLSPAPPLICPLHVTCCPSRLPPPPSTPPPSTPPPSTRPPSTPPPSTPPPSHPPSLNQSYDCYRPPRWLRLHFVNLMHVIPHHPPPIPHPPPPSASSCTRCCVACRPSAPRAARRCSSRSPQAKSSTPVSRGGREGGVKL